ncbi:MAG TPA: FixH family protein [Telluria sp.]|nr:FixH family protein [Telluria sp.]
MHAVVPFFETAHPWYRHRWPWLLMLGPLLVLVGGSVAAYLAYTRSDAMVVGDYYERGKAINQDLRRDRVASILRLAFEARYVQQTGTLDGRLLEFGQGVAKPFHLHFAHPTLPARDLQLEVQPDASGKFSVAFPMREPVRWQVLVEGEQREWRLSRSWHWPRQPVLEIHADAPAAAD